MKRQEAKDDDGRRYVSYDLATQEVTGIIMSHLIGKEDFAVASGSIEWVVMDDNVLGLRFFITID